IGMSAEEQTVKGVPVLGSDPSSPHKDPGPVIGGLNLRSAPGACLLFAGVLLLIGIGVAAGGYWPHRARKPPLHQVSSGRTPAEKLKLVGPVIMGVGLFIFICANTLLYENRDRRWGPYSQGNRFPTRSGRHRKAKSKRHPQPKASFNKGTLALCELRSNSPKDGVTPPTLESSSLCSGSDSIQVSFDLDRGAPLPQDRGSLTLTLPVIKLNNSLISCSEAPPLPEHSYRNLVRGPSGTKADHKTGGDIPTKYMRLL
uniref:Transmembrane protein 200B n=1 Tax=Electrophorus electricus TaxID=8005 RepID=A0A4W4GYT3_ELEEL